MERRRQIGGRRPEGTRKRIRASALSPFYCERSPREEVIEILAEGLWTLICQGRGPAAGKFRALRNDTEDPFDGERDDADRSSSNA